MTFQFSNSQPSASVFGVETIERWLHFLVDDVILNLDTESHKVFMYSNFWMLFFEISQWFKNVCVIEIVLRLAEYKTF